MNKIILSGNGKMGKIIQDLAPNHHCEIVKILDKKEDWDELYDNDLNHHVIIDFSTPDVVLSNIRNAFKLQIPIVVGTTGWHQYLEEIRQDCQTQNGSLVFAFNFSIGMNLFFKLNTFLGKLMQQRDSYQVGIEETHHIQKLDSPSGTAIALRQQLQEYLPKGKHPIAITSYREGTVSGIHTVIYKGIEDEISIRHEAFNRQGFANGALIAANWLKDKKGFYNFADIIFNDD
ncbi:MAG: 4-hydroxy-tetrahydrodipicolinate reductase [Bacteroidales bacterium]|nr:4-hydroxy-tetrahydrodipicolinate reductase [Bacteroidales bacterium]